MTTSPAYSFPVEFRDVHYIAALYTSTLKSVYEKLLGTGLKPGLMYMGKPLVAVGLIQYKDSDLGAYDEVIIAIPVIPEKENTSITNWFQLYTPLKKRTLGQYIIQIPVTSERSMIAGREIWGYPKIVRKMEHGFDGNKIYSQIWDEEGSKSMIEFKGLMGIGIPIPSMDLMTYSFLKNELFKTKVDVKANMQWKPFATLKISIHDQLDPLCKDLMELEICNKNPIFTIASTKFTAKFNEAKKID